MDFSVQPTCIFRIQIDLARHDLVLSDGTPVKIGDRIINLHLWNEHIPRTTDAGPTLGWAKELHSCIEASLFELARYLAARRELDDIFAIRANLSFGTAQQTAQLMRIARRLGFEQFTTPTSCTERVRRFGDNILISMIVFALNPKTLRSDTLWRDRIEVFQSRRMLEERYRRPS